MSKFLKGNYQVENTNNDGNEIKDADFSKVFEAKALEKLGGSIAFVMKSDKFLWEDDEDAN
jgi:hypothetical protein